MLFIKETHFGKTYNVLKTQIDSTALFHSLILCITHCWNRLVGNTSYVLFLEEFSNLIKNWKIHTSSWIWTVATNSHWYRLLSQNFPPFFQFRKSAILHFIKILDLNLFVKIDKLGLPDLICTFTDFIIQQHLQLPSGFLFFRNQCNIWPSWQLQGNWILVNVFRIQLQNT